ncbi:hypothetical protein GOODEAATRI_029774 [Goodea atripinnis]|uniref:Uncharacterized protein n=1 Tax=Goodea atripinnis TaxID=208336 RepID=A0ABV0N5A7_9TELE
MPPPRPRYVCRICRVMEDRERLLVGGSAEAELSELAPINVAVCVREKWAAGRVGGVYVACRRHKGGLIVNTHSRSSGSAAGSLANKPFIKAV